MGFLYILDLIGKVFSTFPLILKKYREFKIKQQEKIINEIDPSSDDSIINGARKLHDSKSK